MNRCDKPSFSGVLVMDYDFVLADKLVAMHGQVEAAKLLADETLVKIEKLHGRFAALLWHLITEREYCKRYGAKGLHILTPLELSKASGIPLQKVEATLVPLLCKGYLRMSGPEAVRAA
jgi:hypothetical protein